MAGHSQLVLVDHPGRDKGDGQAVGEVNHRHPDGFCPPARRTGDLSTKQYAGRATSAGCLISATLAATRDPDLRPHGLFCDEDAPRVYRVLPCALGNPPA